MDRRKFLSLTAAISFTILTSCTHSGTRVETGVSLTDNFVAQKYSNIYFSAQPPLKEFRQLKRQGFVAIVNLRQEKEEAYSAGLEKRAAELANLEYEHIPMSGKAPLDDKTIDKVTAAVVKHRKNGKVLVHCSTGNRAGLWAGGHFYKDHGYKREEALAVAKKLGLTQEKPTQVLERYLSEQGKELF